MPDDLLTVVLADAVPDRAAVVAVEQALRGLGLPAARAEGAGEVVGALVSEARSREAFEGDPRPVTVAVRSEPGAVAVTVRDARIPDVGGAAADRESWERARRGLVDGLRTESGPDGNVAEFRLWLPDDRPARAGESRIEPEPEVVDDAAAAGLVCRPAEPADARGIVRLTYRCYGYSYVDPRMYAVDALAQALESGDLRSQVAVSRAGEVVGHMALVADAHERLPEYGRFMVDPRWRGRQVAERLGRVAMEVARESGVPGVWSECVANHAASQRAVRALGGVEVGLLLGAVPDDLEMSRFDNPLQGRMSVVPMVIMLQQGTRRRTYLPAHLHAAYAEIAGTLGLDREVRDSDDRPAGQADIRVSLAPGLQSARVSVLHPGEDGVERVAEEIRAMAAGGMAVVYLDVALGYSSAPRAIRRAEAHGFFWAALLPEAHPSGDMLRLQRIGWVGVDTEDVRFASAWGEHLGDFVLAERRRVEAP